MDLSNLFLSKRPRPEKFQCKWRARELRWIQRTSDVESRILKCSYDVLHLNYIKKVRVRKKEIQGFQDPERMMGAQSAQSPLVPLLPFLKLCNYNVTFIP